MYLAFQEHAIEARLMHIVHAIEHKEWPVAINFTAGDEIEIIQPQQCEKDTSEVITITTDHGVSRALAAGNANVNNNNSNPNALTANVVTATASTVSTTAAASKKRKRHIAIDVETERGESSLINLL